MSHAARVCVGLYLPSQRYQGLIEKVDGLPKIDRDVYLVSRGAWFGVAALFGLGNMLGFVFVGWKAVN